MFVTTPLELSLDENNYFIFLVLNVFFLWFFHCFFDLLKISEAEV
jgi:hypothetical protein